MKAILKVKGPGAKSGLPAQELIAPPMQSPTPEMVARRAYEIWQRHGCPSGTSFHDWLAAEAELRYSRSCGCASSGCQ